MSGSAKRYLVEFIGTAVLVLIGCGAVAIGGYGGSFPLGVVPVAFAFGLAVTAMAAAIGAISGCHINPAVTVSFVMAGRMSWGEALGYIIAQFAGGIIGALLLIIILKGKLAGYDVGVAGLGQNGWGEGYLGGYGFSAALVTELIATFIFTTVILGSTEPKSGIGTVAGIVIGLTLFALHLPFIQVTGLSVNPARSLGPAIFVGGTALSQVWLFLVVPTIGGAIAGALFRARILSHTS